MAAGVYLHIPFCKSRCLYCDFATDVYRESGAVQRYVDALCQELSFVVPLDPEVGNAVDTVYFGGGTPSLLTPSQLEQLFSAVTAKFIVSDDAEITLEMNPATVTLESLDGYRSAGVNRASFGVQTFDDRALKLLARGHDADDARNTFSMLRRAGFDNISFDLIAGLPGQLLDDWKANLDEAIALSPEHISLYLLEIHAGTPLAEQVSSRRQPGPDDDLAAEMYEIMLDRLDDAGYKQYEISNFSRPGFESRHNTKYWRLDPVYGFGVSAHSFDGTERYANERDTAKYVTQVVAGLSPEVSRETVDTASEFTFLGLRLEAGIDLAEYGDRFGHDLIDAYSQELELIMEAGLVAAEKGRLRLTRKGKLLSNQVFSIFV